MNWFCGNFLVSITGNTIDSRRSIKIRRQKKGGSAVKLIYFRSASGVFFIYKEPANFSGHILNQYIQFI